MSTWVSYLHPDTEYLVRHAMTTGYQLSSLLVPPVYIVYVLARRGQIAFSINRVLRATWVGGLSGKSACTIDYKPFSKFEQFRHYCVRRRGVCSIREFEPRVS